MSISCEVLDVLGLEDSDQAIIVASCSQCKNDNNTTKFALNGHVRPSHFNDKFDYTHWCVSLCCGEHSWWVCKLCRVKLSSKLQRHGAKHPSHAATLNNNMTNVEAIIDDEDHSPSPLVIFDEEPAESIPYSTVAGDVSESTSSAPNGDERGAMLGKRKLLGMSTTEPEFLALHFGRQQSIDFFKDNLENDTACECLVTRAFKRIANPTLIAKREEALYHFTKAKNLKSQTRNGQEEAAFLDHIMVNSPTNDWQTRFATSISEYRKFYLHGPKSVLQMLPYPAIHTLNGHAYVSLTEILAGS